MGEIIDKLSRMPFKTKSTEGLLFITCFLFDLDSLPPHQIPVKLKLSFQLVKRILKLPIQFRIPDEFKSGCCDKNQFFHWVHPKAILEKGGFYLLWRKLVDVNFGGTDFIAGFTCLLRIVVPMQIVFCVDISDKC